MSNTGPENRRPGSWLASYWLSSGERILVLAEGRGGLEIIDIAADLRGPSYRVERAFEDEAVLSALIEDYLKQARKLDLPPMSEMALTALMLSRGD